MEGRELMLRRWMQSACRACGLVVACLALAAVACQQDSTPPCEGADCTNTDVEPNGTFLRARPVVLSAEQATLRGTIDTTQDVDVFDLGPADAGDSLQLYFHRQVGGLRAGLALYNGDGELIIEDTSTSLESSTADPLIQQVIRFDTAHVYIAATEALERSALGAYTMDVRFQRGAGLIAPQSQIVLLDFGGGTFSDPFLGDTTAGPFNAADISPDFAGQTVRMQEIIENVMRANYARFNITVLSTRTDKRPAAGTYSNVIFGGFSDFAFGASENVDLYNADHTDKSIIFTDGFQPEFFGVNLTAEDIAVAIGNVASHEFGHLLGLNHVTDATEIMDEKSPADTLLDDQTFHTAPLAKSIFPLGSQNSPQLLDAIVGVSAQAKTAAPMQLKQTARRTPGFTPPPNTPGKCALGNHH